MQPPLLLLGRFAGLAPAHGDAELNQARHVGLLCRHATGISGDLLQHLAVDRAGLRRGAGRLVEPVLQGLQFGGAAGGEAAGEVLGVEQLGLLGQVLEKGGLALELGTNQQQVGIGGTELGDQLLHGVVDLGLAAGGIDADIGR